MRPELEAIVTELLRTSKAGEAIELDVLGEAIGTRAIAQDEIDAMIAAIEKAGRAVTSRSANGELALKTVLATARALRTELGRAPRAAEIAERSGLAEAEVQHALALAKIIQR